MPGRPAAAGSKNPEPVTVRTALTEARSRLQQAGICSAHLDARLLAAAAAQVPLETLLLNDEMPLDEAVAVRFEALLERRERREPVSRILGRREFWSLPFAVTQDVLDPRPDSETLIEAILARRADLPRAPKLLDLGTGSGCLLLALLSEWPDATGVGVDISGAALAVARRNAEALGLATRAAFVRRDWLDGISGTFDVVVGNPPYIASGELGRLDAEVADFDPVIALDGGADGLACYRRILQGVPAVLSGGGVIGLEVGAGQAAKVARLLELEGFSSVSVARDLSGLDRCLIAINAGQKQAQGKKKVGL